LYTDRFVAAGVHSPIATSARCSAAMVRACCTQTPSRGGLITLENRTQDPTPTQSPATPTQSPDPDAVPRPLSSSTPYLRRPLIFVTVAKRHASEQPFVPSVH
jgi:hypothetical protein